MSNDKNNVTLDMSHGGLGNLLTEVVRAYLHTGNPSACMNRILQGVDQYRAEVADTVSQDDHRLNSCLRHTVFASLSQLQDVEDILANKESVLPTAGFKDSE